MYIGIDTETFLIDRAELAPKMVCYQWCDTNGAKLVKHDVAGSIIQTHLLSDNYLLGANVAFDMGVIYANYLHLRDLIWAKYARNEIIDIFIAERLIDIAKGTYAVNDKIKGYYSLGKIAALYGFEKDADDPWRLRYGELYDVPLSEWPPEAKQYATHDVEVLEPIFTQQLKHVNWLGDVENQTRYAWCLHLMSCWGVHTEPSKVEKLRVEVEALISTARDALLARQLLGPKSKKDPTLKRNTRAVQKIAWDECKRLGIEPSWTKAGLKLEIDKRELKHVCLDAEACEAIGLEVLDHYSTYVTQNTIKTRVEDLSKGYYLPLQARFDVLKETGRTSSKKTTGATEGTQLQNMPVKLNLRECFVPRDGYCFLGGDYSSAELHTMSQACLNLFGVSKMAEALNAGRDVHVQFAARILGVGYEEAKTRYDAGDPEVGACRDDEAKRCNFGLGGGMGWKRLQATIWQYGRKRISDSRAKTLVRLWKEEWPEMVLFFRYVNDRLAGREKITTKAWSADRYRGRVGYCDGCNELFQIPAADGVKRALWNVSHASYNEPDSPLYGYRPWNIVHDEIIGECTLDRIHEASIEFKRLMEEGINYYIPDVPTTVEPVAMMFWSKEAKPVFDERGRLIPWNG